MQAGYPNPEATHIMCGLTLTKLQRCAHPTPNRRPLMLRLPICERRVTVAGVVVVVCAGKEAVAEIESALALIPSEPTTEPATQPSGATTTAEAADPIKEEQASEQQEGAEDPAPAEATEQEGKEEEKPEEEHGGEEEESKAEGSADAGPEEAAQGEADAAMTAAKKGEAAARRPHTPWHFQGLDRCVQPAYSICLAWSLARPSLR